VHKLTLLRITNVSCIRFTNIKPVKELPVPTVVFIRKQVFKAFK